MSGLFARKQSINNTATKIGALRIQNSSQGVPIQITFGTTRVTPNLLDYEDFTSIPRTETTETGGKGGGGTTISNTTFTYTVALMLGLGEGPVVAVETAWRNKDVTLASGGLGMSLFNGSANQTAWPYMTGNHPTKARNLRGEAYLSVPAFDLGDNASLPNMSFEVFGLGGPDLCAPDVNPATVMSLLLTSTQYGLGFSNFPTPSVFSNFCNASNLLVSPNYKEQRPASELISDLAKIGNSALVWSEGNLKVIPYGDSVVSFQPYVFSGCSCVLGPVATYTPDLTPVYDLTHDDFLDTPPVKVRRKRPADAFNMVQVKCLDRANDYNIAVVEAKDQAAIDQYGLRTAQMIDAEMICDLSIARRVAQAALQRELYYRNTYSFTVGWKYARLEPMDIVSLTDPSSGLSQALVRVISIDEDEEGRLSITAEDVFNGVATPGVYGVQTSDGFIANNAAPPGNAFAPVIFQPPVELSGVPQVWIGTAGGANWGGAEVWVSDDNASYTRAAVINAPARYGTLAANFPASSSPDTTNVLSVNFSVSGGALTSATIAQADALDTISFVGTANGGEIIAYSTANLVSANVYNMSGYILRGQRCSFSSPHLVGESFMRLDDAVARINVDEARVGQTIYFKLLSFNVFGQALQTLSSVSPSTYVVRPVGIVAVNGTIPNIISAGQVLCIGPSQQFSVLGRLTNAGRVNADGRLIIT